MEKRHTTAHWLWGKGRSLRPYEGPSSRWRFFGCDPFSLCRPMGLGKGHSKWEPRNLAAGNSWKNLQGPFVWRSWLNRYDIVNLSYLNNHLYHTEELVERYLNWHQRTGILKSQKNMEQSFWLGLVASCQMANHTMDEHQTRTTLDNKKRLQGLKWGYPCLEFRGGIRIIFYGDSGCDEDTLKRRSCYYRRSRSFRIGITPRALGSFH